jgi:hypothetical protein
MDLRSRPLRFGLEPTQIVDWATPAFGFACFANVSSVQDQPMMRVLPEARRHNFQKAKLDRERRFAGRKRNSV